jgi:hypothetical protein
LAGFEFPFKDWHWEKRGNFLCLKLQSLCVQKNV